MDGRDDREESRSATTAPGRRLLLRENPGDFRVEEIPAYPPDGVEGHLLLWVEKTGRTTDQLVRDLAETLALEPRSIGFAGRKDRWAISRQWLSVPLPPERLQEVEQLELEGVKVLEVHPHSRKLRLGDLRGNRFQITLRGRHADGFEAEKGAERMRRRGMVNRFGPQRFGRRGGNAEDGLDVLTGRGPRRDPRLARFLVSALQSELFHRMLAARAAELGVDEAEASRTLLEGDVLFQHATGFLQRLEIDAEREGSAAWRAVEEGRLSPTAMLFGPSAWRARARVGEIEDRVLRDAAIDVEDRGTRRTLERLRLRGTRRALRVQVGELTWDGRPVDPVWRFVLPPGSYATVLIDQLYGEGVVQEAPRS